MEVTGGKPGKKARRKGRFRYTFRGWMQRFCLFLFLVVIVGIVVKAFQDLAKERAETRERDFKSGPLHLALSHI